MQVLVSFTNLEEKIAIGVKYGDDKPHPLRRSKERNGILNSIKEGTISHFHKFSELKKRNEKEREDVSIGVSVQLGCSE